MQQLVKQGCDTFRSRAGKNFNVIYDTDFDLSCITIYIYVHIEANIQSLNLCTNIVIKSKRLGLGDDIFKMVSKSLIKITFREEEQEEEANVGFVGNQDLPRIQA